MKHKTDQELAAMAVAIQHEQTRRADIANLPGMIQGLIEQWETLVPDDPDGWKHVGGGDDE